MSACAITIGGSAGSVQLSYTLGSSVNTLLCNYGDTVYADSAATACTYTTLTGGAIPSSGCLTFSNVPVNYYQIGWEGISQSSPFIWDSFFLDSSGTSISSSNVGYPFNIRPLIQAINGAANPAISVTSSKVVGSTDYYIILKIVGTAIPSLRLTDPGNSNSHYLYMKSTSASSAVPSGFTPVFS